MEQELFKRSKYSDRLRLTAADLETQQAYDRGKRLLLNRCLYGRGVVYGFNSSYDLPRAGILLGPGLALDAQGREVLATQDVFLPIHSIFTVSPLSVDDWYLCVRYQERACGEGHVLMPDGTHAIVPNRIEEGYQAVAVQSPGEDEICLAHLVIAIGKAGLPDLLAVKPVQNNRISRAGVESPASSTGIIRMHCEKYMHSSNIFYTGEISHGLGAGPVQVTLWVACGEQERRCSVGGAAELFEPGFRTAVRLFPDSGTFTAAVQAESVVNGMLEIRWYAQHVHRTMGVCEEWYRP